MAKAKRTYLHSRNVNGNLHFAAQWVNENLTTADLVLSLHPIGHGAITVIVWRSTTKPTKQEQEWAGLPL